jgi:hypothetical protein
MNVPFASPTFTIQTFSTPLEDTAVALLPCAEAVVPLDVLFVKTG